MKPAEFYEILEKFVYEQQRWKSLQVGDTVYEEVPRGFENDYHEAKITSINVDERFIFVHDESSQVYREVKWTHFLTQEEFEKL